MNVQGVTGTSQDYTVCYGCGGGGKCKKSKGKGYRKILHWTKGLDNTARHSSNHNDIGRVYLLSLQ